APTNCRALALAAATAAQSWSATRFNEYFKSTATATRTPFASRLTSVDTECGSSTTGATTYYCSHAYDYCESNVLAYTLSSANVVVNGHKYYTAPPSLSGTCHAQDQLTTALHELTHAPGVYFPCTAEYWYGCAAVTALTSAKTVLDADSYALYASAIHVGCFKFRKNQSVSLEQWRRDEGGRGGKGVEDLALSR
ncbi:Deuterolysin, partial [Calycina marina]